MRNGSLAFHQSTSGPGDGTSTRAGSQTSPASCRRLEATLKRARQQNSHPESRIPTGIRVCLTASLVLPLRCGTMWALAVRFARQPDRCRAEMDPPPRRPTPRDSRRESVTVMYPHGPKITAAPQPCQPASQPASHHTKIAYSTRKARTPG